MSGDENNNWLNTAPVAGDSRGGFPSGSGIEVRPDGLKLFSTQAEGEATNFATGYEEGVAPLMLASANIGGSFQEAAQFSGRHGQAIQKTGMLSGDVGMGLAALGMGARTVAIKYLNGDATSAATLPDVLGAFDVSKGDGLRAQAEAAGELPKNGDDAPVGLPAPQSVDPNDFGNPNDPGRSDTIQLGDNASYTVAGASDCLDIEMATPATTAPVEAQFSDDLATEKYQPAPYKPDDYR